MRDARVVFGLEREERRVCEDARVLGELAQVRRVVRVHAPCRLCADAVGMQSGRRVHLLEDPFQAGVIVARQRVGKLPAVGIASWVLVVEEEACHLTIRSAARTVSVCERLLESRATFDCGRATHHCRAGQRT